MALLSGQPVLLRFAAALSKCLNQLDEAKDGYGELSRLLPGDQEALAGLAEIESRQRILNAPLRVRAEPKRAPSDPITVNLLYKCWDQFWLRQTPGGTGRWRNHQFVANREEGRSDWVVVYEVLDRPRMVTCRQGKLVQATGEPPSLSRCCRGSLDQFDLVVTFARGSAPSPRPAVPGSAALAHRAVRSGGMARIGTHRLRPAVQRDGEWTRLSPFPPLCPTRWSPKGISPAHNSCGS
ncbi:hypothetical protein TSH7_30460 [Azospirillum sp. TSH7]|nr:hypothetical protein TSH7_30460 [Azospirillum sp. TSH7]PWC71086.1 hypothetical protein TSH20_04590 [Azospirillum sp. TSH20]